ncbi:MAG: hypothetical protein R3199_03575 [Gemmatimonadota bacterium]|nr:hypothetical protein [Gemmatimonadota bacterium]
MPDFWFSWTFWYAVGGAIVAIAAILLIAILVVARGIEREAERALAAVREIEANTRVLWQLGPAREAMERIRWASESIADKVEALAGAVHGETGRRGVAP